VQRSISTVHWWGRASRIRVWFYCAVAVLGCFSPGAAGQDTLVPPPRVVESVGPSTGEMTIPTDLRPRPLGSAAASRSARTVADASGPAGAKSLAGASLFQTLASLGVVLGIILAMGAGAKRVLRGGGRGGIAAALGVMGAGTSPAGILEVIGRYPLSRGTSLVLIKIERRVLLLAQSSQGMRLRGSAPVPTLLCEISDPEEVASIIIKANEADGRSIGATFRQALSGFERQHDGVIEEPRPSLLGRLVRRGSGGDRSELLDGRVTVRDADPLRLRDFERQRTDVVGSLRSRATALRAGGVGLAQGGSR